MTKNNIIIGDIGGTKSRFVCLPNIKSEFKEIKVYINSNYSSFEKVFSEYLKSTAIKEKNILLLAVAGPVIKGEAFLTNLSWKISIKDIKKEFQFKKIFLVNDLYALSGCVFHLRKSDLKPIKKAPSNKTYPKAFLAPGTGLGLSFLISKNPLKILPSEGGHIPFSPQNEDEYEFLKFLKTKNKPQTYEEALSGRGLSNWYAFYTGKELSPEDITERAKNGEKEAIKVIKKFFELLGRRCYEISVSLQPFGGIYLAGGVLEALREFFEQKDIIQGFYENFYFFEHMKKLLENIPIYLILHPFPVLLGALTILHSRLK
ncbi:MAG: ROK family protein [Caldimicrobium sp.]